MGQEHLPTAVAREAEFVHDLLLLGFRHGLSVVVGPLTVRIALELLEAEPVRAGALGEATTRRAELVATGSARVAQFSTRNSATDLLAAYRLALP